MKIQSAFCHTLVRLIFLYLFFLFLITDSSAAAPGTDVKLKIGSVQLDPADMTQSSCVQIPIFINEPSLDNRVLESLTITLDLTGSTESIVGGVVSNMVVANAFGFSVQTGLTDPGTDLENIYSGVPTATCNLVFNRATQGQGSQADFPPGDTSSPAVFTTNNLDGIGRKQIVVVNISNPFTIVSLPINEDFLVGVLEVPLIANPGDGKIFITATAESVLSAGNAYVWTPPPRISLEAARINSLLDLSDAAGEINISSPPIKLKIGDLLIDPLDMMQGSCVQIPIIIEERSIANRDLQQLVFTLELTGDTGVIVGGAVADVLVTNAFGSGPAVGITSPGTDLDNQFNTDPTPTCGLIFNQATQAQGPAIDYFVSGSSPGWFNQNDQGGVGRKQGFVLDFMGDSLGMLPINTDILVGVLEIPIQANPGIASISITATPDNVLNGGNRFFWDNGVRRVLLDSLLDLSEAIGRVEFVDRIFGDGFEN